MNEFYTAAQLVHFFEDGLIKLTGKQTTKDQNLKLYMDVSLSNGPTKFL